MLISDFVVIIASASWLLCIMAFSLSVFHFCCKYSYHLEAPDAQKVNTLNFNDWQQRINLCVSQYLGIVLILVFLSQRGALQRWVELTGELGLTRSLAVSPAMTTLNAGLLTSVITGQMRKLKSAGWIRSGKIDHKKALEHYIQWSCHRNSLSWKYKSSWLEWFGSILQARETSPKNVNIAWIYISDYSLLPALSPQKLGHYKCSSSNRLLAEQRLPNYFNIDSVSWLCCN